MEGTWLTMNASGLSATPPPNWIDIAR